MKRLIIKLLNKIISNIEKDINKQTDDTNIEDVVEKYHKHIKSLPYIDYYDRFGKFIKTDKLVPIGWWVCLEDGKVYEHRGNGIVILISNNLYV